jgi:hypothetical protein
MALLYIWEFTELVQAGPIPIARAPGILQQTAIAIGAVSTQSPAFNTATRFIRVATDAVCSINIGTNPTAIAQGSARMAANQTEYFGVNGGDKLAVIATTP